MPLPSPRNQILPARGTYSELASYIYSLGEGEICYATDQDILYVRRGTSLVPIGGGTGNVESVNSQTGVVVLDAADVGALPITGGTVTGTITATAFVGDGSGLTNIDLDIAALPVLP